VRYIGDRLSSIWKEAGFRRFWIGESISGLGSSVTAFVLPLVGVIVLRMTPGQMGMLRALENSPGIFIGLLAGVWVDRVSRQRLLIALNVIAGLLLLWIPIAHTLGVLSPTHLYLLALALGMLGPFWFPAWNAFLPSIVPSDLLFEANSKMSLSFSAAGITGPVIGGILTESIGSPLALLADVISFFVGAAFLASVRPRRPERTTSAEMPVPRLVAEGLKLTFRDPIQWAITLPQAMLEFVNALIISVLVIYVIREVRLTPGFLGVALGAGSAGFLAGSVIGPRIERRLHTGRAILLGLGLVAASPYTMVLANHKYPTAVNVICFMVPGLVGGLGGIIQYVGFQSVRQSITPERLLGRVYASASVLGSILTVGGALLGGLLGDTLGLRPTMLIAAVGYAAPFLYSLFSPLRTVSLDVRTEGSPDEPSIADPDG
jgi:MFS family permease